MAMTHDELLTRLWEKRNSLCDNLDVHFALSAVVELHSPVGVVCGWCTCQDCDHIVDYPCKTIQAIEKDLW